MSDENEQGEPVTFEEVFDAATPRLRPGARKEDLLAALRHTAATGGHVPGQVAPDISQPVVMDLSGKGVHPAVMKAIASGANGLDDIAGALAASQAPPAALPPPSEAGAALAELYFDMLAGGIPLASVERIIGAMLATPPEGKSEP